MEKSYNNSGKHERLDPHLGRVVSRKLAVARAAVHERRDAADAASSEAKWAAVRREAAAARARETERQQERYLKGLGRFSPKKMRLGACEKMRLSEGGGLLGAFGRAAAKAGRARTAAAAADRSAACSEHGAGAAARSMARE